MDKEYRLSSYCIMTELNAEPDSVCLIHGYTGAIDVVDKSIASFLERSSSFRKSDIPCSKSTCDALEKRGYITYRTPIEEVDYVKRLAKALFRRDLFQRAGFTVVVSYDCNFRCPYCFEKGIKKDSTTFSKDMTDNLYQVIEKLAQEKFTHSKCITLYGGEPLTSVNKKNVSYLIEKGKSLGFTFSAITNGYDLEHYEEFLSPDCISFMQITIDGLPEHHNKRRLHYRGLPTFDKIVQNIGIALNHGVKVSVRVNTDRDNMEDLKKLNDLFLDLHYTNNPMFSMYSALLLNYSNKESSNYKYLKPAEYIQELQKRKLESIYKDQGLSNNICTAIRNNLPLRFKATFCSAQTTGFVLDPLGNIYPCWDVVNIKEHRLGSYNENTIQWNNQILNEWRKCTLIENDCIECKYALFCSGGCPASRKNDNKCMRMMDIVNYSVNKAFMAEFNN